MTAAPTKRRRLRMILPFVPVLALIAVTLVAHSAQQTDPAEPAYLAPTASGPLGGRDLAYRVRARGVAIITDTDTGDALQRMARLGADVTLFIPAPQFVHPAYRDVLDQAPDGATIVLVDPDVSALDDIVSPLGVGERRWATAVTEPGAGCPLTSAGAAAVTRSRFRKIANSLREPVFCYDGGLARLRYNDVDFIAVGSDEPFRADRLAEHDNARLAVDLLSTHKTLIWLDLHAAEPAPPLDEDQTVPGYTPPQRQSGGGAPGGSSSGSQAPSPFPDWLFWTVLALLLAGLALALAKGRRLGAPATEPLPVEVRGAETALGRGRLYRRARARGPALDILRTAAGGRLRTALGLPSAAGREQLLAALEARLPGQRARIEEVLYGPAPASDADLHTRATELRSLVDHMTGTRINEGELR